MICKATLLSKVVSGQAERGIRKTDERFGLEVFSADLPVSEDFEYNVRGLVYKGEKLVFKSPPHARESVPLDLDLKKYSVSVMREGTVIRVFKDDGQWLVATNRKLDASRSKWGSGKNFSEMFADSIDIVFGISLEEFLERLDPTIGYVFLIGTNEYTRVVSPQYDGLVILESFDMTTLKPRHDERFSSYYVPESEFNSVVEAKEFVDSLEYPFEFGHGVFLHSDSESYKIENSKYLELANLRHNLSSIPFAYLHNCFDPKNRDRFEMLYPDYVKEFRFYDSEIESIAYDLLHKYIGKYVYREPVDISKPDERVLWNIHGFYLKNHRKILLGDVMCVLENQPPSSINKIIAERKRRRILEERASIMI